MTFFLSEQPVRARGLDVAPTTNAEAIGAAVRNYWQSINVMMQRERQVIWERDRTALGAAKAMGSDMTAFIDEYNQRAEAAGLTDRRLTPDMTPEEVLAAVGPNGSKRFLEMAREKAAQDRTKFGDLDLTDEGIEARVTEKRKAEAEADATIIALSPNPVRNQIVGGLLGGVTDPVNLLTVPLSGGGSLLRILGREVLLNAGVEALQFPTRKRVAEELGQEAPEFVPSVLMGALTGVAFGGVTEGVPRLIRGLMAAREARKVSRLADVSPATQEAGIQAAERAIAEGRPVDEAVTKMILGEPARTPRPLILDDEMRVPEPTALAPDPIASAPLPELLNTPATAPSSPSKPSVARKEVLSFFKARGGVDPDGWLGTELKARGLSNKTQRGLFKKGGIRDVDNIPFDEVDPSIAYRVGKAQDGLYLDRDGIMRVFDEEMGTPRAKPYGREYDPRKAYGDPDPDERGFLVNDLPARQMAEPDAWRETLASDFDAYLVKANKPLLPRERDEILNILYTRGGDAEDLVYSAYAREIEAGEEAVLRTMRGEAYGRPSSNVPWGDETGMGPVPDRPDGSLAGEPEAAAGNAAEPGEGAVGFEVERTDIGDQYVIPGSRGPAGVDKQRQQAEIEARRIQSKIRRLNQARVEDDVDGLFAAKQVDLFDDLSSPGAQSYMEAEMANMRTLLEDGEIEMSALSDDGTALASLSDIIDEIDETDALVREFAKCRGGATE